MKAVFKIGPTPEQEAADQYARDSLQFRAEPETAEQIREGIAEHLWREIERERKRG